MESVYNLLPACTLTNLAHFSTKFEVSQMGIHGLIALKYIYFTGSLKLSFGPCKRYDKIGTSLSFGGVYKKKNNIFIGIKKVIG